MTSSVACVWCSFSVIFSFSVSSRGLSDFLLVTSFGVCILVFYAWRSFWCSFVLFNFALVSL